MSDLFDYMPALGKADTSREAAIRIAPHMSPMRKLVYDNIPYSGITGSELADKLNKSVTSIRPRLTDLYNQHLIEDTGNRRMNRDGFNEKVFAKIKGQTQ